MPLDAAALRRGCGEGVETAHQLCRAQLDRFRAALAEGGLITVGCTQEQPLFTEVAEDAGLADLLAFANVREAAGWSTEAAAAGPKMAALLAAAAVPMPAIALVALKSEGVALILGRDERALEAARQLAPHLDVTVLLRPGAEVAPPRQTEFPVLQGAVRSARGHLGAFELVVDAYAAPAASSRSRLAFGAARDGAVSTCDLVLDLTGGPALFPAADLRPGYLRADPRGPAAVQRAIFEAANLVGTFDKPRYVDFDAAICAHSRNRITGCTRCLDLCPTGAITPAGDSVTIDPMVCAGCGQCAAACPTGAASYALPPVDAVMARLRTLLATYRTAGGRHPALLIHDGEHGVELIDACGRFGDGLPAHVLPLQVNEVTQVGPELIAAAFAYGAQEVRILTRARPRHDITGLTTTLELAATVLAALGYGTDRLGLLQTDDPDTLAGAFAKPSGPDRTTVAGFVPAGTKRGLMETAFRELHRVAPAPVDVVPLPAGAPFGTITVDTDACTLCLACVSACPADALGDNPERPMLRFTESLCVQCGLCAATCPEDAITLTPQIDFPAWSTPRRVLNEDEPFHCTSCGKAFGTRATIERVREKLGAHWMFSGPEGERRRRVLEMCDDCRVQSVMNESFDPHDLGTRVVRTTEDYLRERKNQPN
jgi:ferredoxin